MADDLMQFDGKNVKMTRWGLDITGDLEWDEFSQIGKKLMTVHDGMQLCLGDWVNYGDTRWGAKYRDALEKTPYPYDTLAAFAWVARRFPPDIREQICSREQQATYTRLRAVARLTDDQAVHMLELSASGKWSVHRLEDEVATRYPRPDAPTRLAEVGTDDDAEWGRIRKVQHFGRPSGAGVYIWFGKSELPLLQQTLPKHTGTQLMRKRLEQVVDAKAK